MKGSGGKSRLSAYVIRRAALEFYAKHHLFPAGIAAELPCVQDWGLRIGWALKKLAGAPVNS